MRSSFDGVEVEVVTSHGPAAIRWSRVTFMSFPLSVTMCDSAALWLFILWGTNTTWRSARTWNSWCEAFVCMYECMYVFVYLYMSVCIYVYACMNVHTCVHVWMNAVIFCMSEYMNVCMYECVYVEFRTNEFMHVAYNWNQINCNTYLSTAWRCPAIQYKSFWSHLIKHTFHLMTSHQTTVRHLSSPFITPRFLTSPLTTLDHKKQH